MERRLSNPGETEVLIQGVRDYFQAHGLAPPSAWFINRLRRLLRSPTDSSNSAVTASIFEEAAVWQSKCGQPQLFLDELRRLGVANGSTKKPTYRDAQRKYVSFLKAHPKRWAGRSTLTPEQVLLEDSLQRAADRARKSELRQRMKTTGLSHPELVADQEKSREPSVHEVRLELVRTALGQLSESDRFLLDALLRGRKLLDVAAELKLTSHAIRKRFRRAIERIRRVIAEHSG